MTMLHRMAAFITVGFMTVVPVAKAAAQQAQPQPSPPQWYGPGPWHMWGDGYGWQFWWLCPLMMLAVLGVIVIILLARRHPAEGFGPFASPWRGASHSALQILSERFARGEIQKDEYEEKRAAILSGR
jgi:putative membrane protein